jgi:hypothetical protein
MCAQLRDMSVEHRGSRRLMRASWFVGGAVVTVTGPKCNAPLVMIDHRGRNARGRGASAYALIPPSHQPHEEALAPWRGYP